MTEQTFTSLWRWALWNSGKEHFCGRNSKCKSPKLEGCYIHKQHEEKVREEERRNVIINGLSKKKKKKKKLWFSVFVNFLHHDWFQVTTMMMGNVTLEWGVHNWFSWACSHRHRTTMLVVPNRFIEMCSTQLVIREMKIRTTVKDHLTSVSVAIIRKMKTSRCWRVYGEKGSSKLLVGIQTCTAIERNCVGIPHKAKNKTTKDSVTLFHSPSLLEMVTAYISERHYWLLFIFAIPIVWRVYYSLTCMANVNLLESKTFLQEKRFFLSTYLCSANKGVRT